MASYIKEVNDEQYANIWFIPVTLEVLKLDKLISVISEQ